MSFSIEALLGLKKSFSKKEEEKIEISNKCFSWRAMEFSKDGKSNRNNDETSILTGNEFIQRKRSYGRPSNHHEKLKGIVFVIYFCRYYFRKF